MVLLSFRTHSLLHLIIRECPTSMSSNSNDRFTDVSSLYGHGPVVAWYFTLLAVFISWTAHPRKSRTGSIDVDLIAILTLPAVAVAHVFWQAPLILLHRVYDRDVDTSPRVARLVAATEAPFVISETFMAFSVILLSIAAWNSCFRRALIVAVTGLACFAVECYVHFNDTAGRGYVPGTLAKNYPAFSRLFVADFKALVVTIMVLLVTQAGFGGMFLVWMLKEKKEGAGSRLQASTRAGTTTTSPSSRSNRRTNDEPTSSAVRPSQRHSNNRERDTERTLRTIKILLIAFLPLSMFATILSSSPVFYHSFWYHSVTVTPEGPWKEVSRALQRLGRDFFPRTNFSITDLDQAVTAGAGASVLGFSVYSVAKAYHETWTRPEGTTESIEMHRWPTSTRNP